MLFPSEYYPAVHDDEWKYIDVTVLSSFVSDIFCSLNHGTQLDTSKHGTPETISTEYFYKTSTVIRTL